jgi:hypothetical protein
MRRIEEQALKHEVLGIFAEFLRSSTRGLAR